MHEPPENELVSFLNTAVRPIGDACRTNPRRQTSAIAQLSWWERKGARTVRARLVNISRVGAALVTRRPPPVAAVARLRLEGEELSPWIEAEVLGAEPVGRGGHRVRLQFRDACPNFFLVTAILGPTRSAEETVPAAPALDPAPGTESPRPIVVGDAER